MAIPGIVLGIVSAVTSIAGAVGSTVSSIGQAKAQETAYKQQADYERQAADLNAQMQERQDAKTLAKQQNIMAASGGSISSGTPLDTALDSYFNARQNALNIRYGGAVRAQQSLYGATEARANQRAAVYGGLFKGASIASDIYGKYKTGVFDFPTTNTYGKGKEY